MKLSDIKANKSEFKRRVTQCTELAVEDVDVNDGCKSPIELHSRLDKNPIESDWSPLYKAAGKFS